MKYLFITLLLVVFSLLYISCGILDSGGGMNPIYYATKKKIYIINSDGTGIKFLTYGSIPKFSNDGNNIYYSNGDSLCSIAIDGSNRKVLLSSDMPLWDYSISTDGKFIAASTFYNLYLLNSDGSFVHHLISESAGNFDDNESISFNDSLIIYQRHFGISIIDLSGGNQKDIFIQDSAHEYFEPHFTNDGKKFIYTFRTYFNEWYIKISALQTPSSITSNIYSYPSFHDYTTGREDIKISPNNNVIFSALANQNSKSFYIHLINLNTMHDNILTDGYDVNYSLDWTKVTYLKPSDASKSIYIYDLSTSSSAVVNTNLTWADLFHPQLNNNKKIIFEADSTYPDGHYFQ